MMPNNIFVGQGFPPERSCSTMALFHKEFQDADNLAAIIKIVEIAVNRRDIILKRQKLPQHAVRDDAIEWGKMLNF